MVYLECPRCETVTEHQIIGLRKDRVEARCTECVYEWRGVIISWVKVGRVGFDLETAIKTFLVSKEWGFSEDLDIFLKFVKKEGLRIREG